MQTVIITTANKLSAAQFKKAQSVIEKKMKMDTTDISYEQIIDPTVLGGIKITAGSKEIDATVQGKLEKIRKQLLSGI